MATVQDTAQKMLDAGEHGTFCCNACGREEGIFASDHWDKDELDARLGLLTGLIEHVLYDHVGRADLLKVTHTVVLKGREF